MTFFQIGMLIGAWGALLFGFGSVGVAVGVTSAILLQWGFAAIRHGSAISALGPSDLKTTGTRSDE